MSRTQGWEGERTSSEMAGRDGTNGPGGDNLKLRLSGDWFMCRWPALESRSAGM